MSLCPGSRSHGFTLFGSRLPGFTLPVPACPGAWRPDAPRGRPGRRRQLCGRHTEEAGARQVVEPGTLAFRTGGDGPVRPYEPTPTSRGDECRLAGACKILGVSDPECRPVTVGTAYRPECGPDPGRVGLTGTRCPSRLPLPNCPLGPWGAGRLRAERVAV
ncbi:hypothetical protein GCM10010430_11350 [Kitasatospora cystarginea]|uniref:Uncharacterized protein n=1 Tax=Kitasatospora cystarginea TaxID=58350 RepID=A0ABP5QDD6_9ACTN